MRHDDDIDENGICRDGGKIRVPMTALDHAMHRALDDECRQLIDAALRRPGPRYQTQQARDASFNVRQAAYAAYEARLRDEYKNSIGGNASNDPATGFGSSGPRGSREGDACTKNGFPGRLVRGKNGELVCQIPAGRGDALSKRIQKYGPRGEEEGYEVEEEDGLGIGTCSRCNGSGIEPGHKSNRLGA
jgi:hypothetical protein